MSRRLMCILAHPDDESLGTGGILAKYAAEGVETYLVTATRGERGRFGSAETSPGLEIVGKAREKEVREAAKILGIKGISFLDYIDGDLDKAPVPEAAQKITAEICRIKPHVVVTFGMEGGYGHPDHIAISQLTSSAVVHAAGKNHSGEPWSVSKLYWMAWPRQIWDAYQAAFKKLVISVDGIERQANPVPDWMITTYVDCTEYWRTVWAAVQCHKTQMTVYSKIGMLTEYQHRQLWGNQTFLRIFSLVNGGRNQETDLFEGIPDDL